MDSISRATSEGVDPEIQSRLAEMEGREPAVDTIPIPLNEDALARQTRLQLLSDEIEDLQLQLGDLKAKVLRVGHQAAGAVKTSAKSMDDSAHAQLGACPWAKLAGAAVATVVGTRLLRMLPFGGILSVAAPLVISQIKAGNTRSSRR